MWWKQMGALALAISLCPGTHAQPGRQVPTLRATSLTGDPVTIPETLRGRTGVLVLGFSQGSREQVTAWGRRLAGDFRDSDKVTYYEMPVLAGVPRLLRGWVLKKVKEGVPPRAQAHCVPVLEGEADWKSAAGVSDVDQAYVLVVDGTGTVLWKTKGVASDEAYNELRRHVGSQP